MKTRIGKTKSNKWANNQLAINGLDWYVVRYIDGSYDCKHASALSSILQCGHDMADYDIAQMEQCWNGEDIGEYPF